MSLSPTERIYVALDTPDVNKAVSLAEKLTGHVGGVKLGMEFYYANGPEGARAVTDVGMPLFLDLKFHDIPNTVAGAVRSTLELNPAILNVHAQGGPRNDACRTGGTGQRGRDKAAADCRYGSDVAQ